ncbi:MAG TPA: Wzz/FepE/Etk N-terminal domain-containing protein [Candidatus Thermoplasmatota archaeon]|nr:Wzz/FepE/Etk N-terminal domain-containing protein [Candidatus Thermoplasmatota archaeon]
MPDAVVPEPQEVTLADIVRVLWRRRYVLLTVFLVVLGGGVAYTVLKAPTYTAKATLVAIEQQDVIVRWLESRQAAEWVAQRLGAPLAQELYPDGGEPTPQEVGRDLASRVTIEQVPVQAGRVDRTLRVAVGFTDPGLARDIANAYTDSLEVIRPSLQNVTESALFAQFYKGENPADARRQAHQVALEREYWLVVDRAYAPQSPSSPNVSLNVALSVVGGLMLGVLAAFLAEWVAGYRVSSRAPPVPPPSPPAASGTFRYRAP